MSDTARIDLATTAPFRIGALCVERALRQVSTSATDAETLEPRVMLVLVALARAGGGAGGGIVSRDQLIEQCWDSRVVGDDSINRVISCLRKLAGAHGDDTLFSIETISKVGYRLVGSSTERVETGATGLPAIVKRSLYKRPLFIATTTALGLVAMVAGVSLWPTSAANDGVVQLAIATSAGPGAPPGAAQALHDEMASVFGLERLRIVDGTRGDVYRLTAKVTQIAGEQVVFGELRPPGNGPPIWSPRLAVRDVGTLTGVAGQLMWAASCDVDSDATRAPVNRSPSRSRPGQAGARRTPRTIRTIFGRSKRCAWRSRRNRASSTRNRRLRSSWALKPMSSPVRKPKRCARKAVALQTLQL